MTKSKALKILNEYYQKNGNIVLYYLYDWYEKELNFYKNLIGDTSLSNTLRDFYCGVINLEFLINSLQEETTSLTDTISPDLLIKDGYVTFGKVARELQMNTFKCNQYDEDNCWLPMYSKSSKKLHDDFYNNHINTIKVKLKEKVDNYNRMTQMMRLTRPPKRIINPNI